MLGILVINNERILTTTVTLKNYKFLFSLIAKWSVHRQKANGSEAVVVAQRFINPNTFNTTVILLISQKSLKSRSFEWKECAFVRVLLFGTQLNINIYHNMKFELRTWVEGQQKSTLASQTLDMNTFELLLYLNKKTFVIIKMQNSMKGQSPFSSIAKWSVH